MLDLLQRSCNTNTSSLRTLSDGFITISANELEIHVANIADLLVGFNIKSLVLHLDNSIGWILVDLACQKAEICLVPVPTFFSVHQIKNVLGATNSDAIICQDLKEFKNFTPISSINLGSCSDYLNGFQYLKLETDKNTNVFWPPTTGKITFTSGSTGNPKGVCLSNQQLFLQAKSLVNAIAIEQPRHLCLLPLSTLLENVAGVYAPILAGGEVIVPSLKEVGFQGSSTLNQNVFIQCIDRYQPNTIILTPQLLMILIACAANGWIVPSSLSFVAVGGARVPKSSLIQAKALGIPVYEGYGLSECASVVSLNTSSNEQEDSSGQPLSHLTVKIENNEVIVSGNTMLGYVGEPDSWGQSRIYTGDIGAIDERGFLTIKGRLKNLLISSYGRNINPEWVESEVLAHPIFSECVIFGDGKPHCIALLTVRDALATQEQIQLTVDKINSELPDYAQIIKWQFFPAPLSSASDLMTDNGRPKRSVITIKYHDLIESLYTNQTNIEKVVNT